MDRRFGPEAALALLLAFGCSNVTGSAADGGAATQACQTNVNPDAGVTSTLGDASDENSGEGGGSCKPGDQDGVIGGCYAFELTVSDTGFSPIILKAQNSGEVTLSLKNTGTKPHDFTVGCISTTNLNGCPPQTCFPAGASIASLAPGGSGSATFVAPNPEGIYIFRSDVPGDSQVEPGGAASGLWGQFVVQ